MQTVTDILPLQILHLFAHMRVQAVILALLMLLVFMFDSCKPFTREIRYIPIQVTSTDSQITSSYVLDPVCSSVHDTVAALCSEYGCNDETTMRGIDSYLERLLNDKLNGLYSSQGISSDSDGGNDNSWINSDDELSRMSYNDTQSEAYHLLHGYLIPREGCTMPHNRRGSKNKECLFQRLADEYKSQHHLQVSGEGEVANLNGLDYMHMLQFGVELFNVQLYYQAKALISYILHNMVHTPFDCWSSASNGSIDVSTYFEAMSRGSLILSEIAKLQGDIEGATYHSLRILRIHERCYLPFLRYVDHQSTDRPLVLDRNSADEHRRAIANNALVFRLRILLTIPPTPPSYATAGHAVT
jgi:hypothetical protein